MTHPLRTYTELHISSSPLVKTDSNCVYQISGIPVIHKNTIRVSPNPNNGIIQVQDTNGKEIRKTEIYNLSGLKLYETGLIKNTCVRLKLQKHPRGIYVLQINTENSVIVKKLLIR